MMTCLQQHKILFNSLFYYIQNKIWGLFCVILYVFLDFCKKNKKQTKYIFLTVKINVGRHLLYNIKMNEWMIFFLLFFILYFMSLRKLTLKRHSNTLKYSGILHTNKHFLVTKYEIWMNKWNECIKTPS